MTEVASPASGHPGPMSGQRERHDSQDSVDRELDWLIQNAETSEHQPVTTAKSFSPRGSPRSPPPANPDDDDDGFDRYPPQRPKSRTGAEEDEDTAPEYDGEDFDIFQMSDDKRKAMIEHEHMKLDLAYTTDEEPPEYDVTERLRQLNAELAEDPTPLDDSRERSIKFQENPVSLVVPPADYSDTEEDSNGQTDATNNMESEPEPVDSRNTVGSPHEAEKGGSEQKQEEMESGGGGDYVTQQHQQQQQGDDDRDSTDGAERQRRGSGDAASPRSSAAAAEESTENTGQQRETVESREHESRYSDRHDYEEAAQSDGEEEEEKQQREQKEQTASREETPGDTEHNTGQTQSNEEKVLIEKNGKFIYVDPSELTAEEREMHGVQTQEDKEAAAENQQMEPKPPSYPRSRPATAANGNGGGGRRNRGAPRSSSAMGQSSSGTCDNFTYQSPYAMTSEEKKRRLKEQREEEQRKKEEEQQKKEQEDRDKADSEDAFQAWLNLKKKDAQRKRKEDEEHKKKHQGEKKQQEDDRDNDSAFKEWLKVKKTQKKETQDAEKKMMKEYDEGYYVRSRQECQKAFKEWLKKKNADLRKAQQEEMAKARVHKLLARKSRKSQQLARAIKQAQAFKYVDYYGYRY